MEEVAAILLAAGRSTRMGRFKPRLPFGDTTVVQSCVNNLRAAGVREIALVLGHRGDDIRSHLQDANLTYVINPDPESPMSASIVCGVERLSSKPKALLIGLVDHPAVDAATIKIIIEEWERGSKLVQPEHQGRGGHPVLIDLVYRPELLRLDPEKGLRFFFNTHRQKVRRVTVESPYVARDMDTWEDYVRLHTDVFGRPPEGDPPSFS